MSGNWTVIDHEGVPRHQWSLSKYLSAPVSGWPLVQYVVRNMGYVAFALKRDVLTVRFYPERVLPEALVGFYYWLAEHQPSRTVLYCGDGRVPEIIAWRASLIRRMNELVANQHLGADLVFLSRDRCLKNMSDVPALSKIANIWRESQQVAAERLAELSEEHIESRFILVRYANGELIVAKAGEGLDIFGSGWLSIAKGLRFVDLPDPIYGRHAAKDYLKAAVGKHPIFQDVDAVMHAPKIGYVRRRYTRLLLPIYDRQCGDFVLCTSIRNARIDLRIKAVHKNL